MSDRDADLQAFEQRIGTRLPEDYRQFLLRGSLPVWTDEEAPENPFTELRYSLFDLGASEDRGDLADAYEDRSPELPAWFLQIAEQFGVLIGIGISGSQRGRIYQWSWDDGEEHELDASFEAFVDRIGREEELWEA